MGVPRYLTPIQNLILAALRDGGLPPKGILRALPESLKQDYFYSTLRRLRLAGMVTKADKHGGAYSLSDTGKAALDGAESGDIPVTSCATEIAALTRPLTDAQIARQRAETAARTTLGRALRTRAQEFERAGFPPLPTKRREDAR